ncbi:hypothetical protein DL765_008585 [Monosporascus sp. GIB2]|nr:hypothetical protein DL765_008585 [Monosporascus sp. GIB2]
MVWLNITNPTVEERNLSAFSYLNSRDGKNFYVNRTAYSDEYKSLQFSSDFGLNLPQPYEWDSSHNNSTYENDWPNAWNVTEKDCRDINLICGGSGNADIANISNIYVGCGLLRAAPRRVNEGPAALFDDGSAWQAPVLTCATGLRATIKTVTFVMNGTRGLDSLSVRQIVPKSYTTNGDFPLWGMEDSGLELGGYRPAWGLISPNYESWNNVPSLRAPHLYLPGFSSAADVHVSEFGTGSQTSYNLPGTDFATTVMNTVLALNGPLQQNWPFDLIGSSSMAILRRWQELSWEPSKAGHIINLLWTDIAASAVVGTKDALGHLNAETPMHIMIRPYGKRVTFNLLFGIPAFILAGAIAALIFIALICTCFGGASLTRMRLRVKQVSIGRVFTTFLYPHTSNLTMTSSEWRRSNGEKTVRVGVVAQRGDDTEATHYRSAPDSSWAELPKLVKGQKTAYTL